MMPLLPSPPVAASQWALHSVPALPPVAKRRPSSSISYVLQAPSSKSQTHIPRSAEWPQRLEARASRLFRLAERGSSIAQEPQACLRNATDNVTDNAD
ncbi:hypothetical protein M441DRAFT_148819 [Trichoderma asperellum CBS 433.97]|uniref:Uncharacterized protein n=1 Tax=Trichoderma asperellum (strain ATCC 204424 / CBS 433.97 / NBRC 101777) TaxID=1042311 RepID=A0A2T3YXF3_TRIA4|nr:hypothetical protein M441DRAFT_148819 [Trichoderma asperellum CBS 433.97]PTB37251.1 hypothetical protein M441DRAFT_148819 [Trichoderma asperellum CBS 433.97]